MKEVRSKVSKRSHDGQSKSIEMMEKVCVHNVHVRYAVKGD